MLNWSEFASFTIQHYTFNIERSDERVLAGNSCIDDAVGSAAQPREIQHVVHARTADAVLADLLWQPVPAGRECASDAGARLHQLPDRWRGRHDGTQQRTRRGRRSAVRQGEWVSGAIDDHADPP